MNLVFPHTFVPWFRTVAPHIHAYHGKTFVVAIAGGLIAAGKLASFAQDLAILQAMGIKISSRRAETGSAWGNSIGGSCAPPRDPPPVRILSFGSSIEAIYSWGLDADEDDWNSRRCAGAPFGVLPLRFSNEPF